MVQYRPLDPQKSEIRLVTLLPGKSRDAIRCTLSTASLDSAPEFTALSYVWGDPSETTPITVDNEPFDATVNLEGALRAMRKRWRRRTLWIDAISINQNDVDEKSVQVPQMGRLYSTAPEVLVWLGPSNPNIKLFVSWMRAHAAKSYNTASAHWLLMDTRAKLSGSAKRQRDWALVRASEGYYDFLALTYWGRVWTFQEYILPRVAPMCLCGDMQPFQLPISIRELKDTLFEMDDQATERLEAEYEKMNGDEQAMWATIQDGRLKKMVSTTSTTLSFLEEIRNDHVKSLAELLSQTAERQCFDERDRIFALHGMVPILQDIYPPDYTKPTHVVMLEAATYIVNVDHHTSFLWSSFGLRDERLSNASYLYPSWVPDFTRNTINSLSRHSMLGGVAMLLKLSEDSPASVSVEHKTLRLWARPFGTCKVAVRFAGTGSSVLDQIKELLEIHVWEDWMGKPVRKPETFVSRMAGACVAHHSLLSDISTEDIIETFHAIFEAGSDDLPNGSHESYWDMMPNAIDTLVGKELLITEDGCFGISVGGVKDGDVIVIPPELEHSFVLTPETSTAVDGVGYFKMVGTAIIDGVMRAGELYDQELVEEIAKRDVVEFLVH